MKICFKRSVANDRFEIKISYKLKENRASFFLKSHTERIKRAVQQWTALFY